MTTSDAQTSDQAAEILAEIADLAALRDTAGDNWNLANGECDSARAERLEAQARCDAADDAFAAATRELNEAESRLRMAIAAARAGGFDVYQDASGDHVRPVAPAAAPLLGSGSSV
jgi:hypothetical protein